MSLNERGWEIPDPTPVAKPVRWNRPGSTLDEIRRNLDQRMALLSREMEDRGHETLEESQDFDVGDDTEPYTMYELRSMAADMSPVELYESVFKKPYTPPAPVDPGAPDPAVSPSSSGNNQPVANSSVSSSTKGGN